MRPQGMVTVRAFGTGAGEGFGGQLDAFTVPRVRFDVGPARGGGGVDRFRNVGERIDKTADLPGEKTVAFFPIFDRHGHGVGAEVPGLDDERFLSCKHHPVVGGRDPGASGNGHVERERFPETELLGVLGVCLGQTRGPHHLADFVEMLPFGIGQQVLPPGQIDEIVLQGDEVGKGLEEKPHGIAGIERDLRDAFICRENGCFDLGGIDFRKGDLAHSSTPSLMS